MSGIDDEPYYSGPHAILATQVTLFGQRFYIAILWWVGAIRFRNFQPDYQMSIELGPVWRDMYWPILAYLGFEMAVNVLALVTPGRIAFNRVMSLLRNLFGKVLWTKDITPA